MRLTTVIYIYININYGYWKNLRTIFLNKAFDQLSQRGLFLSEPTQLAHASDAECANITKIVKIWTVHLNHDDINGPETNWRSYHLIFTVITENERPPRTRRTLAGGGSSLIWIAVTRCPESVPRINHPQKFRVLASHSFDSHISPPLAFAAGASGFGMAVSRRSIRSRS